MPIARVSASSAVEAGDPAGIAIADRSAERHPPHACVPSHDARIAAGEDALARMDAALALLPNARELCDAALRREAIVAAGPSASSVTLRGHLLFDATSGSSLGARTPGAEHAAMERVSRHVNALITGSGRSAAEGTLSADILLEVLSELVDPGIEHRSSAAASDVHGGVPAASRDTSAEGRIPRDVREAVIALCGSLDREQRGEQSVIRRASLVRQGIGSLTQRLGECAALGQIALLLILRAGRRPFLTIPPIREREEIDDESLGARNVDSVPPDAIHLSDGVAAQLGDDIVAAVDRALPLLDRIARLTGDDRRRIEELTRAARSAIHVHVALQRRPILSLPRLLGDTGLGVQTATSAIHRLRGLGIVREITGRHRHRVYCYDAYVALLGEEMS